MTKWTIKVIGLLITYHLSLLTTLAQDTFKQMDESGNITERSGNGNFNKHNNDTTKTDKEIPKGYHMWTVDRKFGDVRPAVPDTVHHLYMNSIINTGMYGEYNTIGNNYSARQNRIFIDRDENNSFIFTQPYSHFLLEPDELLFVNTLSPYTRVNYDNCGDKQFGEDRIDAKFAVNANKRLGFGFDLRYDYARGYFSNQNVSHFNGTLFGTYIGDKYQAHVILSTNHQKATENGGITDDQYITHPELQTTSFDESEIPTVLSQNWNRNDNQHVFLSHRYNIGFYHKVKMTEEELKARKFAQESKNSQEKDKEDKDKPIGRDLKQDKPLGRPDGATIMGHEPPKDSTTIAIDSTRIKVNGLAAIDSLKQIVAQQEEEDSTMKKEFVPVTSIIHTLELHNYKRIYQAYETPAGYYQSAYYNQGLAYSNDTIYDPTKHFQVKNTFGLSLLEGFNKYMKAGLKGFITHEYRRYKLPDLIENTDTCMEHSWTEHNVSIGGQLSKTQGETIHFNLMAETWLAGEDAGQLRLEFSTNLNFKVLGDTMKLAVKAFMHRQNPTFYYRKYHSKNLWWDNELEKETRTRIEGLFSYQKTSTSLRVAIERLQHYTYFGMSYDATTSGRQNLTAAVYQESDAINVLTAQLSQNFRLGPLNWENVITYQNSDNADALPLPRINMFSNLYLKFKIAKVLDVELGADGTYFTTYKAADFCPMLNQFAVQKNEDSQIELGGYPFIDVYANLRLKGARFFFMMSNVLNGSGNHMKFLTPHYPTNGMVLHAGVSWPFFN